MTAEDLTIPVGKYDFVWATHDRGPAAKGQSLAGKDATLIIMIHSFPGDSRSYGNVFNEISIQAVKDGFHTLRFDLRGCGHSDKGARFFSLNTAHEDCLTVLRWAGKLGYKKLIFVAEGLGALITLTALTDAVRPQVARMVFLWPILNPAESWFGLLTPLVTAAETEGRNHLLMNDTKVSLSLLRELRDYRLEPLAGRVTMPLFVPYGTSDTMARSGQLDFLIQNTKTDYLELVGFTGGEHGLKKPEERQQLLTQIRAFLRQTALSA